MYNPQTVHSSHLVQVYVLKLQPVKGTREVELP